eukprot:TRINITY_DN4111_c0_g1_i3.p1 TRINITY_DN4111_c0_g1~~TRINITY_DN4111_c0_g1_i3.p1  ORF type:complete len:281 (-),score=35.14 TRINITY_DN4111_c0_g1_i3:28-870(-)
MERLPVDIVLVRHGESELNLAHTYEYLWTDEFSRREHFNYKLTDKGREQSHIAGEWIKENVTPTFDHYFCSNYLRAQETAAILNFPNAKWDADFYLREQDKGILSNLSHSEREREMEKLGLARLKKDMFYIAAPGGESIANVCLRVDQVINQWRSHCSGQRIIAVVHESIMLAFRVRLEGMSQAQYREVTNSGHTHDKIHRCQVTHYTRRNPITGEIADVPSWVRMTVPWNLDLTTNEWQKIVRKVYSNEQLLAEVMKVPQLVNNTSKDQTPDAKANNFC